MSSAIAFSTFVVWLTGKSGAGKTTLAQLLRLKLLSSGVPRVEILDGDVMRESFWKELGFCREDRIENIRRLGRLCELLQRNGIISIVAAISPYREGRNEIRETIVRFVEVHVDCPTAVLITRDVKGLYKRAMKGELSKFTGISDIYEDPLRPEVLVNTSIEAPKESLSRIWNYLKSHYLEQAPEGLSKQGLECSDQESPFQIEIESKAEPLVTEPEQLRNSV